VQLLGDRMMSKKNAEYGTAMERAVDLMPVFIGLGGNDDLFGRMVQMMNQPRYFDTPRKMLELGCGSAPFVYSALARGHDAYGIDNDPEKIQLAHEKIAAYGLDPAWRDRALLGDATQLAFESGTFDVVLGWQVVEHIPNLSAALFEALRVLKPGGLVFFWAPDYRAPYEAHYEMPWPPFAPRYVETEWVLAMDRPVGGIGTFFNVTVPQIVGILEGLGARVFFANIDRPIDVALSRLIDVSTPEKLRVSAKAMLQGMAEGSLPPALTTPTSLMIGAQKT
jgi:ubiquinone/menaquinone biosynthesis C-methylase UbiE